MSFLGFLLILLFIFIGIPLIKVGWKIYRLQREAKKAFSQFNQQQQEHTQEYESQQRKQQKRQRRKSMGEYIEFEEVDNNTTPQQSSTQSQSRIKDEPLITDAEWEEIK